MIVIDASALIEVLLPGSRQQVVDARLFSPNNTLHAPHLIDIEVAQVVRRYTASGQVDADRGRMALVDLADFPMRRYPHVLLLPRVWALRSNLTAFDAVYVALGEALDAPLVTRDRKLAAAAGVFARIEVP